jgi:hypothetical protein
MAKRLRLYAGGAQGEEEELAQALALSLGEAPPAPAAAPGAPALSEEEMRAIALAVSGGAAPGDPRVAQLVAEQERVLGRVTAELSARGSVGATQAGRPLFAEPSSARSAEPYDDW